MPALQVIALDTTTPQLRAPASGDTYSAPRAIELTPETLTGSSATSSLSIAQTWNTTGTPTAIDLNVTDTASNAASNLLNLRRGGVSQFSITKFGEVTSANFVAASEFRSGNSYAISGDVIIRRDAANTLAQRNGTNAQAFNIYNTFTDASNYERGVMAWSSNTLIIGTQSAGTGSTSRNVSIAAQNGAITFTAGFNLCWQINTNSHFVAGVDNTFDIGLSGGSRPRRLYLGGGSLTGSQADSSLSITPTWNTTGTPTAIDLNVTDTASNANSLLMDLRVGGTSRFSVTKGNASGVTVRLGSSGGNADITASGNGLDIGAVSNNHNVILPGATFQRLGVGGGIVVGTGLVTNSPILFGSVQEGNHTLALRNGTNAQAFNVYNTFTDASNYERGFVRWSSNVLLIGAEKLGTGTARDLVLQTDGTTRLTIAAAGTATFASSLSVTGGITASTGNSFIFANRGRLLPASDGVVTLQNSAQSDFGRLQFGGTTSSFPALKRNGTALETKLADDSAFAPHAMQYLDVTDGVTAPGAATGRARIYIDTADGDLKVVFADGTVKTIVTDT